tara:strand:- start:2427 stop:4412 length:1986 start_codon:yes stop_codon:yes gene_type:complete
MNNRLILNIFVCFFFSAVSQDLSSSNNIWECSSSDSEISFANCENQYGKSMFIYEFSELGTDYKINLSLPDDSYFSGESKNGNLFGTSLFADGTTIKGQVIDKAFEGPGEITYQNGDVYKGFLQESLRHGKGSMFGKSNNLLLEGTFESDGFSEGRSYDRETGRLVYDGEWDDGFEGVYDGFGTEYFIDGQIYVGSFVRGRAEGYGENFFPDGDVYKGYFKNGVENGYGEYTFKELNSIRGVNFNKVSGRYLDGERVGQFVLSNNSKIIYIGGLAKNLNFNGQGTFIKCNDFQENNENEDTESCYVESGNFIDSNLNGQGKIDFEDGSYQEGTFKNGYLNGFGKDVYGTNNISSREGFFVDGKLQGIGKEIYLTEGGEIVQLDISYEDGLSMGNGTATFLSDETTCSVFAENNIIIDSNCDETQISAIKKSFNTPRVALVIGNNNYIKTNPLDNAINDAMLIKNTLENAGFEVIFRSDVTFEEFLDSIEIFKEQIKSKGTIVDSLFYYSGHAVQVEGTNYLNPIDTDVNSKYDLDTGSINMNRIFGAMENLSTAVKIIILDACRNNPFTSFTRSPIKGLERMDAPTGYIIGYSTSPGKVAFDDVYTKELVKSMSIPDMKIEEVLKRTRINVANLTNQQQTPWEESSLMGDFYFIKSEPSSK